MAVDERARHQLHGKLEAALGPEEAATLMAHLPPTSWPDLATRSDLQVLELKVMEAIARAQTRLMLVMISTMLATVIAVSGIAFAAAGLT
jgi:hypothetical protein